MVLYYRGIRWIYFFRIYFSNLVIYFNIQIRVAIELSSQYFSSRLVLFDLEEMHCLKGVVSHLAFFAITFHHDLAAIADKQVIKVFNSQNLPSHISHTTF